MPILVSSDISIQFYIKIDSLDFATNIVFLQESKEYDEWHLVAFFSKSFSPIEYNYKIYNKEILAII